MARADALVVTSVREGWGLVVSEAAALGTPSVAYDVPGLRDSVRAAGGRLTQPTPHELAATILAALPEWQRVRPTPVPWGGATSWDVVATAVLDVATHAARTDPIAEQEAGSVRTTAEPASAHLGMPTPPDVPHADPVLTEAGRR